LNLKALAGALEFNPLMHPPTFRPESAQFEGISTGINLTECIKIAFSGA
jgi:hypothetical protein